MTLFSQKKYDCRSLGSINHGQWIEREKREKKKSVREHFNLMLEKFKAKRRHEAKHSGVNAEDSKLDVLMEEISDKWEEAETKNVSFPRKQKAEADRATGEKIRKKACEQLKKTKKRKGETESKPKKTRRSGNEILEFLTEKKLAVRQAESERQSNAQEELLAAQREQQKLHTTMLQMMQNQNNAIFPLLSKMSDNADK